MRKILSALLVVAMLSAMFVCWAVPSVAADEVTGDWNTHARAFEEMDGYDQNDLNSVAGYEYTNDGLKVTTADWSKSASTPWSSVFTTKKVDLRDGVYMKVRIDEFDYNAGDKWFNFSIWSEQAIAEGSGDPRYGTGVQTLIRPKDNGDIKSIEWAYKQFTKAAVDPGVAAPTAMKDDSGKTVFVLEVEYNSGAFTVKINGSPAPKKLTDWMNEYYAANNYEAYIGFTAMCSNMDAAQSFTVTEFGTSSSTYVPTTDDRTTDKKDPQNYSYDIAEIADASDVEDGMPAILMDGKNPGSDLKGIPSSVVGSIVTLNDDNTVHVLGDTSLVDAGEWHVKYDTSYDIADFPVVLCITRDYCKCGMDTLDDCMAFEAAYLYLATGEVTKAESKNKVEVTAYEELFQHDGHNYLAFIYDATDDLKYGESGKFEGRINATRFDFEIDITTMGRNEFDVVLQAFFADEDAALEFAMTYIYGEGSEDTTPEDSDTQAPEGSDTQAPEDSDTQAPEGSDTQAPEGSDTQAPEGSDTQAPEGSDTQAPEGSDSQTPEGSDSQTPEGSDSESKSETNAPTNNTPTTNAPAQTDAPADDDAGCFGTVGFGAAAIVMASLAVGFVTFKKKKD